jgi:hypothetical protein
MEARLRRDKAGLLRTPPRIAPSRRLLVIEVDAEQPSVAFEKYSKSGSEREFARR